MVGVSAYIRDVNLEIPALDYPESPKVLPPLNDDLGISGFVPAPNPPFIVPGREKHKSKELRAQEKKETELYDLFSHMMKTIGFAWGPDFKAGYTLDNIEIVDIYQIMAFLLKIPPNNHDGNWNRVKKMLVLNDAPTTTSNLMLSTLVSLMVLKYNSL